LPVLEEVLFPYLGKGSVVCEIGPGTGRQSRHIAARIAPEGVLHLVDHSPWCCRFLRQYFHSQRNVNVHLGNECSLDFLADESCDAVFSNGTFIGLKLGIIYLYAQEFSRILKPGCFCVLDYIDISTPEGWGYLEEQAEKLGNYFTYHTTGVIDRVFASSGFELVGRHQIGESTYVIMKKNSGAGKGVHNGHN
jgi:ubiquinone/menaquinone biosynthesis C-methylase UbiE